MGSLFYNWRIFLINPVYLLVIILAILYYKLTFRLYPLVMTDIFLTWQWYVQMIQVYIQL